MIQTAQQNPTHTFLHNFSLYVISVCKKYYWSIPTYPSFLNFTTSIYLLRWIAIWVTNMFPLSIELLWPMLVPPKQAHPIPHYLFFFKCASFSAISAACLRISLISLITIPNSLFYYFSYFMLFCIVLSNFTNLDVFKKFESLRAFLRTKWIWDQIWSWNGFNIWGDGKCTFVNFFSAREGADVIGDEFPVVWCFVC